MNSRRLILTIEFLTMQLNHWVLFLPAMTLMGLMAGLTGSGKPDWSMWALVGLLPFLCFLIRRRQRRFAGFCGLHLVLLVLALLIPTADICSRILCIFYTAYCLISSFSIRLKEREAPSATSAFSPALMVAAAAASFLLNHFQGRPDWDRFYFFPLIGCLALYNIVCYLESYQEFLEQHRTTVGSLPAAEILRSGLPPVLGYSLLCALVMLLSVKRGMLALLRVFFSLFSPKEGSQSEYLQEQPVFPTVGETPLLPTAEEPFWLWKILELVIAAAILLGLLYGIVRLLIFLAGYIRERFSDDFAGKAFSGFLSPEIKIRKLYRKKLLACAAEPAEAAKLPFLTARDSEKQLNLHGMAAYYEKARYSAEKPTRQDVRGMQDACAGRSSDV